MADFSVNSTELAPAQGRGTQAIDPVQQRVPYIGPSPVLGTIGDIFAQGLKQNAKDQAAQRMNAVVGEYINNEKVYSDALTSGQWNASQVSTASRANFTKMLASYPEYVSELTSARSAVYGGTEVGEAQKKIDAEKKQQEADIASASGQGYVFYSGMSDDAKNAQIDAYKTAKRVEIQFQQDTARAAENRAQNGETRAAGTYQRSVDDYVAKENATQGARLVASKNFDALTSSFTDLQKQMASGMPYDQALAIHSGNISRIKAGLLSVADKNPEMAAPWIKLFDDMDANIKEQLDPGKKSASDLKLLQDKFNTLVTQGKLAAVERNPAMLKAVVATNLFQGEGMVTLSNAPVVRDWLLDASGVDPSRPAPAQGVGTKNDADIFKNTKDAINRLQSGKIPPDQQGKAAQEATNVVNTLLKQTTTVDGSMDPRALKQASQFYSSTEFGRMALEGKLDKQTAANVQHVFQVQYDPVVKDAIVNRLSQPFDKYESESKNGAKSLLDQVDIQMRGGNVVFQSKAVKPDGKFFSNDTRNQLINDDAAKSFNDAAAGLNQLLRMHAHLEGTTDYAKYWEDHKHELMPSVFPDPAKLKPGQVVDGYKYTGGNYRDRSNWVQQPATK